MKLPRKGILIRIVIYGAALTFFGYGAIRKHLAEKEALEAAESDVVETNLDDLPTKKVVMPDGRTVEVLEMTEEQFEAQFGALPEKPEGEEPAEAASEKAN